MIFERQWCHIAWSLNLVKTTSSLNLWTCARCTARSTIFCWWLLFRDWSLLRVEKRKKEKKRKKKNSCSLSFSFDVIFSRSISRSVDASFLFDFFDRWSRDLNIDYREKIKEQMTWSRWKRFAEERSDYLIDDWVVRINIFDLLTNLATCAFRKILQNDRRDLKEKIFTRDRNKVSKRYSRDASFMI
jgi:hypothetical protein